MVQCSWLESCALVLMIETYLCLFVRRRERKREKAKNNIFDNLFECLLRGNQINSKRLQTGEPNCSNNWIVFDLFFT